MSEPSEFLPRRVFERLKVDDSILKMGDTAYLDVGISRAISDRDPDTMTPWRVLQHVAFFNKRLETVDSAVSAERWFPDPGTPNGCNRFRANDDFIVAYQGDIPLWYWENKDGRWELNRLRVKRADLSYLFDPFELLDEDEDLDLQDEFLEEDEDMELQDGFLGDDEGPDHQGGYRPEELTPMEVFGVVMYFAKSLKSAAASVKNEPCFPDVRDPNGGCRFRGNDGLIVAYRGKEPVWYWKRRECGSWKLYRMDASRMSERFYPSENVELRDGEWGDPPGDG